MKLVCAAALLLLSSLGAACGGAIATDPSTGNQPAAPQPGQSKTPQDGPISFPTAYEGEWTAVAGCGDFQVVARDSSERRFLVVIAKKPLLGISEVGESATLDLSSRKSTSDLTVRIDEYDGPNGGAHYCTDVGVTAPHLTRTLLPITGTLRVAIASAGRDELYGVDVSLEGVYFDHEDGTAELLPNVTMKDVKVGWYPG